MSSCYRRFTSDLAIARMILKHVQRGLLSMAYTPRVRLQPALTIDEATAKNGIAILREVFELAKNERWCDAP